MRETPFASAGHRRLVWILAMIIVLVLVPKLSLAQSMGTILGTVKDASGSVVPQALVTIRNTDTNDIRTAPTSDDGAFRFPALVTGRYSVRVEKEGFKAHTQTGLTLEVTQEMVLNPVLEVGSTAQEVTVTGEAPMVNTTSSVLGGTVNEAKMADLPINGRNYVDLVIMQPGINVASSATGGSQTGGTRGTFFSADGAPYRSNMFTYDGAIMLNGRGGSTTSESGNTLGVGGIKEFKVVTGTYGAEYGNAMGAQVIMVSRGGTNQLHGEVFEYLRNGALDARNPFYFGYLQPGGKRIPHYVRNNFGISGGGPIKKDKTFVFGAYEGLRENRGQTILNNVPAAGCHGAAGTLITTTACPTLTANTVISPITEQLLALYPLPNVGTNQYTRASPQPISVNWGQVRLDQNISATDTLFGRYTFDKSYFSSGTGSTLLATNAGVGWDQLRTKQYGFNQSVSIQENHIFSPQLLNTFRISYTRINYLDETDYPLGVDSLIGPGLSFTAGMPVGSLVVGGLSTWGPSPNFPTSGRLNYYQLAEDMFYSRGKHALKFGYLGVKWNVGHQIAGNQIGTLNFSNLTNFLRGNAAQWSGLANGPTAVTDRNNMYFTHGFYVQDDYRPFSRLTLNLGLRYEFQTQPMDSRGPNFNYGIRNVNTDAGTTQGPMINPLSKRNFSPRVGFAWDIFGDGKTALRGGFGIYYEVGNMSALFIQNSIGQPPLTVGAQHQNTVGTPIQFTLPFTFLPADSLGIQMVDYNLKTPTIQKWNLTVERQFPFAMALSVTYNGSQAYHLYQGLEGNPTIPVFANGRPFWNGTQPRNNPLLGPTRNFTSSGGVSSYNALIVQFNKRLTRGLLLQSGYTWSHNLDNTATQMGNGDCSAATGMAQPSFPNDVSLVDRGPSCVDVTHTFRFNVLYYLPTFKKSDSFAAKITNGWWMGSMYSANSGYAFMPVLNAQRSQSANLGSATDVTNFATAADAAACPAITATCRFVPVPYDANTVMTRTTARWFNPNMFIPAPMFESPGGAVCTTVTCPTPSLAWGTLGNVQRGLLRGPGLSEVNFSINKDTRLGFLGEQGKVVFRAEFFNILNRANYGMPRTQAFAGTNSPVSSYGAAPLANAGQITNTVTSARQIQFALKVVF